jgi:transposase-like protein
VASLSHLFYALFLCVASHPVTHNVTKVWQSLSLTAIDEIIPFAKNSSSGMSYKKLSEEEKQAALQLFLHQVETISSLATRFGVSQTTIRRLLKGSESAAVEVDGESTFTNDLAPTAGVELESGSTETARRARRRSSAAVETPEPVPTFTPPRPLKLKAVALPEEAPEEILEDGLGDDVALADDDLGRDLADDLDGELDDLEDEDLDLDDNLDDDDLDLDDDELDDPLGEGDDFGAAALAIQVQADGHISILPLTHASFPRSCYLVIDRSAELVARPLRDFGELGQIPEAEITEKTLPIFENHRVAKRFANPRTQRVIKLPDAKVLQKTSSHLSAKGITRLLMNGQVYALL